MSIYGWSVFWLIVGLWGGWYARGYLDRLFVQELLRRRLNEDRTVRVDWNPVVNLRTSPDSDD